MVNTISARQIQLNHALGLGPMWVSRAAQIISCKSSAQTGRSHTPHCRAILRLSPLWRTLLPLLSPLAPTIHSNPLRPVPQTTTVPRPVMRRPTQRRTRRGLTGSHCPSTRKTSPSKTAPKQPLPEHTVVAADCSQDSLLSLQTKITQCTACDLHGERRC